MSRSYLAKKIHEIDVLQRLGKDLPAEMSDRPNSASAPRRHARRVSAEVEHADRRRVTSAERLPPLTYTAEERAPLTAAARRTPLTGAESLPLLTAAVERTSRTDAESSPPGGRRRLPRLPAAAAVQFRAYALCQQPCLGCRWRRQRGRRRGEREKREEKNCQRGGWW